jgi:hypothetical protein
VIANIKVSFYFIIENVFMSKWRQSCCILKNKLYFLLYYYYYYVNRHAFIVGYLFYYIIYFIILYSFGRNDKVQYVLISLGKGSRKRVLALLTCQFITLGDYEMITMVWHDIKPYKRHLVELDGLWQSYFRVLSKSIYASNHFCEC